MYYTPKTLAQRWDCSAWTVYDLLTQGRLAGFKVGRSWRISEEARIAYEDQNRAAPPAPPKMRTRAGPVGRIV